MAFDSSNSDGTLMLTEVGVSIPPVVVDPGIIRFQTDGLILVFDG